MSRKWWAAIIIIAVVVGGFAAIKLMPLWATLVATGSFAFGAFSGYVLKKKEIIEKPVEVIKEVPVEKIVYKEVPAETWAVPESAEPEVKAKTRKRNRNKKVAE